MKSDNIVGKIHNSMYQQLKKDGFAAPVKVLIDVGVLSAGDHERWRFGRVDYLERVCKVNLKKLSAIMKEVRAYARKNDLKPSWTFYRQWGQKGKKPSIRLRFSKSGNDDIEKQYATHYVRKVKTEASTDETNVTIGTTGTDRENGATGDNES